jgi:hypothetical protein
MHIPSFRSWLENRPQEVPDAMTLALVIARAGAAGVSRDDLRRLTQLTPDTLEDLLAALMSAGQVVAIKAGGRLVYRAAG